MKNTLVFAGPDLTFHDFSGDELETLAPARLLPIIGWARETVEGEQIG